MAREVAQKLELPVHIELIIGSSLWTPLCHAVKVSFRFLLLLRLR